MSDFKITLRLASPLFERTSAARQPIMLDGALARIQLERQGIRKTSAELKPENLVFADLPIEKVGKCYLCSAVFFPKTVYEQYGAYAKRPVVSQNVCRSLPSYLPTGAPAEPALFYHVQNAVPDISFYVRVIDERKDEFISLLKDLKNYGIGPKTSIGFGRIAKIDISLNKQHPDLCYRTEDGIPTRALPVDDFREKINVDKTAIGRSTYYAPYWFVKNKVSCFLPSPKQYAPRPLINQNAVSDLSQKLATTIAEQKTRQAKKAKAL